MDRNVREEQRHSKRGLFIGVGVLVGIAVLMAVMVAVMGPGNRPVIGDVKMGAKYTDVTGKLGAPDMSDEDSMDYLSFAFMEANGSLSFGYEGDKITSVVWTSDAFAGTSEGVAEAHLKLNEIVSHIYEMYGDPTDYVEFQDLSGFKYVWEYSNGMYIEVKIVEAPIGGEARVTCTQRKG